MRKSAVSFSAKIGPSRLSLTAVWRPAAGTPTTGRRHMSITIKDCAKVSVRVGGVMRAALGVAGLILIVGCVSHTGHPALRTAITTEAPPGFRMTEPRILEGKHGARIKGALCWSVVYKPRPREVVVSRQSPGGQINTQRARLIGASSSQRRPGCAYYDARTDWILGSRDALKVSANAQ